MSITIKSICAASALIVLAGGVASQSAGSSRDAIAEPETSTRSFLDRGDYHGALKILPKVMEQWAEYTGITGRTAEGAAAFEHAHTFSRIASEGDAYWGTMLDDPEIPYEYKTKMIFSILEERLGKGAVYRAGEDNLIVPRKGRIDLNIDRIGLPGKETGREAGEPGDAPE
jgi:hypothetical protein